MAKPKKAVDPSEWDVDRSTYDMDKFYTTAKDTKGFSASMHTRIPPTIETQISRLVHSKRFEELQTPSDFVRDAIFHRLTYLSDKVNDSPLSNVLRTVRMIQERINAEQCYQDFKQIIDDAAQVVNSYGHDGIQEAKKYVSDLISEVEDMPTYWKNKYVREIKQRFGHLL